MICLNICKNLLTYFTNVKHYIKYTVDFITRVPQFNRFESNRDNIKSRASNFYHSFTKCTGTSVQKIKARFYYLRDVLLIMLCRYLFLSFS